jgi:glycosyltransferase involved in cell wall biosynthesis
VEISRGLGVTTFVHDQNMGYGKNQKTCYREALERGADIVVMVHPDYQYSPKLVTPMAGMIACGEYDAVIASRILGNGALEGGMPLYKYVANRFLTAFQNLLLGQKLSEYHTGFRAFSRPVLEQLPLEENTNDFVFDNEMLAQIIFSRFRIGEISCPTRYFEEASSINFARSVRYGFGVLSISLRFRLQKMGLGSFRIFARDGSGLVWPARLCPKSISPRKPVRLSSAVHGQTGTEPVAVATGLFARLTRLLPQAVPYPD